MSETRTPYEAGTPGEVDPPDWAGYTKGRMISDFATGKDDDIELLILGVGAVCRVYNVNHFIEIADVDHEEMNKQARANAQLIKRAFSPENGIDALNRQLDAANAEIERLKKQVASRDSWLDLHEAEGE